MKPAPVAAHPNLTTKYSILFAICTVHLLNDTIQSIVTAVLPILSDSLALTFFQVGLITFALNVTASILQPVIGLYSDARPKPYLLPFGMVSTLAGVAGLALSQHFATVLLSVTLIGIGSSVFHPESARVAYLAAGSRRGLAQSIFQVGGNAGQALAPIMTALIFVPLGQIGILWFTIAAIAAIILQTFTARWYDLQLKIGNIRRKNARVNQTATAETRTGEHVGSAETDTAKHSTTVGVTTGKYSETISADTRTDPARRRKIVIAIAILVLLLTSKMAYLSGFTSFYHFYVIDQFGVTVDRAQWFIFAFLAAGAVATFFGGPIADWIGRRYIIWFSILGSVPFTLLLPYANMKWSVVLCLLIGITLLSSSSVIVVYAQELVPGKIGTVSGLFFGLSFGMGGLSAAVFGAFAEQVGVATVMGWISYLPLIGVLTLMLPSDRQLRKWAEEAESSVAANA